MAILCMAVSLSWYRPLAETLSVLIGKVYLTTLPQMEYALFIAVDSTISQPMDGPNFSGCYNLCDPTMLNMKEKFARHIAIALRTAMYIVSQTEQNSHSQKETGTYFHSKRGGGARRYHRMEGRVSISHQCSPEWVPCIISESRRGPSQVSV